MTSADDPENPPGYPRQWIADVVLADGATMHLRPIRPADGPAIQALHRRLSAETIYFRFFTPLSTLSPRLLDHFVRVDYVDRFALVGVLGDDIIAVARSERLPSWVPGKAEAEVAFLVDDAHQGRGIATVLLEHLTAIAATAGITGFVADTLPDNKRMLRVFHEAGFDDQRTFADGVVRVAFPIQPTDASRTVAHDRERRAAARSVRRLLAPRTVAVIGAGTRRSLGHVLLRSLLDGDPQVTVYPINPHAHAVAGVRAYPTVLDVPDSVDLAVIVVPAAQVAGVVEQCARKQVGGLAIISAGFAERDAEGAALERSLVGAARRNGMRVIGPASMGIVNTDPTVNLNATFSPSPPRGRIGFVAQSGALGVVLLDEMARRGLGVSTFVSAGNKADVSGNDLLQYWDEDPATDVVLMYIESFGNPRTFARVARRVARHKPIVAVKSGRSPAGTRAAGAHRPVQDDGVVDALFRQAGVLRTETLEELFDVAQVLASQPLPAGRRVAIVTDVGGPAVLAADACAAAGLEVATLSEATEDRIRVLTGPEDHPVGGAEGVNPVGLPPGASPSLFRHVLTAVLADAGVDAGLALYTSPMAAPIAAVTEALGEAATPTKPLLACVFGRRELLDCGTGRPKIPAFAFPEAAARALGVVARYAEWRAKPHSALPQLDQVDAEGARTQVEAWLSDVEAASEDPSPSPDPSSKNQKSQPDRPLQANEAAGLLACYGIVVAEEAPVASFETLPVAVAVSQDPHFGALISVGTSAHFGETPRPTAGRAAPLTEADIAELVDEAVATARPDDQRWDETELAAVRDVVARVGRLAEDLPEVVELAINPLLVDHGRAVATSPAGKLRRWLPRPELAIRRLS
ncbi:MAG: GNAT family N-acetyltransferase [Actinomycetota bacterium]|nr:GNAT family N-acetyltransferase [Actinomycetota bacterium]